MCPAGPLGRSAACRTMLVSKTTPGLSMPGGCFLFCAVGFHFGFYEIIQLFVGHGIGRGSPGGAMKKLRKRHAGTWRFLFEQASLDQILNHMAAVAPSLLSARIDAAHELVR